ncbi:hypothetical protein F0562_006366 [Nyssa sinensis]|uniref:Uncharacterized protein n=1 Tax=Nyssa sinensis TaxID=561372 RepID=A0A5J5ARB3_9ASTE|nr:hypothetical protein F0562_006366 [Nyssa sinensis]
MAAMANYLKFDIYDLELTSLYSDSELRRILVSTSNHSILVIEDIDCSVDMQDRLLGNELSNTKLALSGLLNFMDGLWSSCGDEKSIVFTTNYKDQIDPDLLRRGRVDMHILMSYCTTQGFKLLASNYLDIRGHHKLFGEIEGLIETVKPTPDEVAEELMRSENPDVALGGVVNLPERKQIEASNIKEGKTNAPEVQQAKRLKTDGAKRELRHRHLPLSIGGSGAGKLDPDMIATLKKEAEKRRALKNQEHGKYKEITDDDFLSEVTGG